jgi:hypothetical protein
VTPDDLAPVLRRLTGREPVAWSVRDEGAYSRAGRWVVTWAGGGSAFVKAEATPDDRHGVAVEHRVYASVESPSVPRLYGYDGGPPAVLVTEDLSYARWGAPVTPADAAALRTALDGLGALTAPEGLAAVGTGPGWTAFAADPAPLVTTGLAGAAWAERHLGALTAAAAGADTGGDRLCHLDVWLQNWCRTERGVVLVDWAGCGAGNPLAMRAWGEAAVRAAGGPPGVVLDGRPEWAAWMAGNAAFYLSKADPDTPPRLVETERREAVATLRWACEETGLPVPEHTFGDLGSWRP